ncbi:MULTISPECIES: AAA family ATPase [Acinetobacter]|uniref:Protein CR006 P-loop domain-containing protein n=1 Tax=Acinetobacter chengduensis TaxID=2420890 RepID=A0ABX9TVR1_9GAMM|nr:MULTISPECIES: AAA family ATPase [Acinetobacter]RKG39130.1 hypothetical protein D7V31_14085 [Acinetobacter sp. WCHAc060007]RLL21833.1 hypothetical protein D9K81_09080 [Acinetobacter chengduensis]
MKIQKISEIKNFSIFKDFKWDDNLSLGNNQTYDFKDINIFYGRNYSGKTSLSKIIRSLETKKIPDKYDSPDFKIKLADNREITHISLQNFNHPIHVYNSDFVKENLKFIHNEDDDIESFLVTLGGENQQILDRIRVLEAELGSNEASSKSGIYLFIQNKDKDVNDACENHDSKKRNLDKLLSDKATRSSDSIKNQHENFGNIRYDKRNLEADISEVQKSNYQVLTDHQKEEKRALVKQTELPSPPNIPKYTLNFSSLVQATNETLKTVVNLSGKIEELTNNPTLNSWVQTGHQLHHDRDTCAFCSNKISDERAENLKQHFNQEFQLLQSRISKGIQLLDNDLENEIFKFTLDITPYYPHYHSKLSALKSNLDSVFSQQKASLKQLKVILEQKKKNPFIELESINPQDYSLEITTILEQVSDIRSECIQFNSDLKAEQIQAKNALRLDHVYDFLQSINHYQLTSDIEQAFQTIEPLKNELKNLTDRKDIILSEIKTEEAKLKSEGEACKRINEILQHDFGHQYLSLEPIETANINGQSIKFEIQRLRNGNKTKAHNLSEGECSLISFCYFLAKIQDDLDQDKKPIIWIDDPICSLDSNHIFFIYSLINEKICGLKKFSQLFISTHNLDFLKYLKRLNNSFNNNGVTPNLKIAKFLIQRFENHSMISKMPNYLSEYATEFNYLFNQIHTCASTNLLSDHNHSFFYNFSNNARKFIEIYSFYKFPTYFREDDERLKNFWNDEIYRLFIGRVNNEYSHCAGVLERGMSLMDVPEMHRVAKAIIQKVKEDTQQYTALLESINIDIANDPLNSPQIAVA